MAFVSIGSLINSLSLVKGNLASQGIIFVTYCVSTENFRKKLAELMSSRGLTISELAKKSGIHYVMISNYLKAGKSGKLPSLKTLLALSAALHCTLEELTGLEQLHDAEKKVPELSPDSLRFGKFFESLLDGDPLKEYLRKIMETKSDPSDTEKGGPTGPK